MAEATALKPHLERLNAGKTPWTADQESVAGYKRRKLNSTETKPTPSATELRESSDAIFEWLGKGTDSNLRMLIVNLSAGGIFYAAHAADKTA
eukprot:2174907-Karenia_brevis.AAC.1